ncbi:MAG: PorV/PorQ family protein [Candidatus Zixiibacteriota bacterium]
MRYREWAMAGAVVLLIVGSAVAGSDLKIGSAGGQELRIPVGSRGTAMGGSSVAYATGIDALFWNPAGAATVQGTDLMLSRRKYIADIDVDYVAAARRLGDAGVLALTAKILSMNDELVTTVDAPDGTGEMFSSSFSVIGLSYARTLTDRVSLGISGNLVYEKIAEQTATGAAFDIGFRYDPGWNNLTFGAVIKNLGPDMRFDGPGFDENTQVGDDPNSLPHTTRTQPASFEIPSYVQLGAAYKFVAGNRSECNVTGAFQSNNFAQDEYKVGAEYGYDHKFFLRGGYTAADQKDYIYGLTLGGGAALTLGETTLYFDYAWSQSEFFDDNHYFTFQIGF